MLLTGEKDDFNLEVFGQKPGIVGQTDSIEESLKKLGFTNVTRRVMPGAGHSSFPADVWKAFLPD
jgi:glycerol-3-phosphate acyltransferase PlsY